MTPLEQASAILKAAEEYRDAHSKLATTRMEMSLVEWGDISNLLLELRTRSHLVALALIEKHRALEEAVAHINELLRISMPYEDEAKAARAFLARQGEAA